MSHQMRRCRRTPGYENNTLTRKFLGSLRDGAAVTLLSTTYTHTSLEGFA
ncbi:hypothetical protein [Streptomyces flaveus]|uniref:Uncharacterized protein n=1 Tax=Streptomyces flaveus TaxID=66370 RepID=A0A917VS12_9ACTN|nr:hypothetical protein [Streptomyces flaveus]GGL08449.1 hypothetical protein GCM10010094_81520 [Streptomyces flaveus]